MFATVSGATALAGLAALGSTGSAQAATHHAVGSLNAKPAQLHQPAAGEHAGSAVVRPQGLPASGSYAFLLKLSTPSTVTAFRAAHSRGTSAATDAAHSQMATIASAQRAVIAKLPAKTPVLYRTHAALDAVAVTSDVANFGALSRIPGVVKVYPIAAKTLSNSYAVPLQGAPTVWTAHSNTGAAAKVAIIDTGIDYTHANFGGPGTKAAYTTAHAAETTAADPALFPTAKVAGGIDLVGDSYDAAPTDSTYQPVPHPDPNPLDCEGHGSHVAGTVGGYGENADGSTYTGAYNTSTPFDSMRIGPGMAPGAKLYAVRVFGCAGSTDVVGAALDYTVDPNGDGSPADHLDVANLSLGSDYGSPDDGDSVAANAASDAGVTVVVASGNAGDYQDVGGSPGDAAKVITAAASVDAQSVVDSLNVTVGATPAQYAAERSIAYDYDTKPDLVGTVVMAPADNLTGCTAFSSADAPALAGKIVVLKWTAEALECGSVARSTNVKNAGGIGFIFANSQETFSGGITGSTTIPGVLVAKSGGDAIKAALAAGTPVVVTGTTKNGAKQVFPADNDKLTDFTSRGIHAAGNVKPDVTAVGATVFSTSSGTGNEGETESGTSMATPMTAGLAALVKTAHAAWTPEQIKADIMNTAGQDLYVNGSAAADKGATFAPNRVGAGRIKADSAIDNSVLAYNATDAGTVSVSFGPVAASAPLTLSKSVTLENTGAAAVSYALSYDPITSVPGTSYTVTPASVSIPAGGKVTAKVTFAVTDVGAMTKTVDPTIGRDGIVNPYPRETLSDASGRMLATPTTGTAPQLRVPVYAAPRPASAMSQAGTVGLTGSTTQTGSLHLTGTDLGQGGKNGTGDADTSDDIKSLAAGFELAATSGALPACSSTATANNRCYRLPEERAGDVKYVGTTSDYQINGGNVGASQAYFAVSTYSPFTIPASKLYYEVDIDTDGDHAPDLALYNTRLGLDDIFVAELVNLHTNAVLDDELIDNRFGDTDAALYDSDSLILPLYLPMLASFGVNAASPNVNYGVITYSAFSNGVIDAVGEGSDGSVNLSANLFTPGISVTDSAGAGPLVDDVSGSTLTVKRNLDSYNDDQGEGLLMLHLHNKVGAKAQVVGLGSASTSTVTVTPSTVVRGAAVSVDLTVAGQSGEVAPTGTVDLVDATSGTTLGSGDLVNGKATVTLHLPKPGIYSLEAVYGGDATYAGSTSAPVSLTVTKAVPTLTAKTSTVTGIVGKPINVRVTIPTVNGIAPTGLVRLKRGTAILATATLSANQALMTFKPTAAGTYQLVVGYPGDSTYSSGNSNTLTVVVKPKKKS